MGEGGVVALEGALGLRPTWINGGMETFGPGGSVIAAMMAVAGGMARHVLCFRTLWEATFQQLMKDGKMAPPGGAAHHQLAAAVRRRPRRRTRLALNAQRHFDRYGTTRETLGWIALNQRANAALNPTAIYRDPMTMDDYLDRPDDHHAVRALRLRRAVRRRGRRRSCPPSTPPRTCAKPPVLLRGGRHPDRRAHSTGTRAPSPTSRRCSARPRTCGRARRCGPATSTSPSCTTGSRFNCLSWLEALGFCGIGEAKDFLDGGKNIARDGVLPLNTHGGQLSHGRTHGMGLIHEAVTQLRGEAGERQVTGAQVAVVSSGGLTPSGVLLLRGQMISEGGARVARHGAPARGRADASGGPLMTVTVRPPGW